MNPLRSPLSFAFVSTLFVTALGACRCNEPLVLVDVEEEAPAEETPDIGERGTPFDGPTDTTPIQRTPIERIAVVPNCVDADGDGMGDGWGCAGADCDDSDANIGATATGDCFTGPADTLPSTGNLSNPNNWTADHFESRLFALRPARFGTASARNYVFDSIIGLHENSPRLSPWTASDPLVTPLCTGNGGNVRQNGLEYQKLSIRTGGVRYPICEYQSFDAVFREVASGIVQSSQLACDFAIAAVPPGSSMNDASLEFVPGTTAPRVPLTRVAGAAACTGDAFFVDGATITLCPAACARWQADEDARVDVLFACSPR